jgi:uncharacterized membrane protein YcaP (DUF421 family)
MDIVLRATLAYLFILLLTRVVGRRELSSLEPFDLILLVTQNDFSVTGMFLAVGTIGLLAVLFSYLPWRFQVLRPVLEGVPAILIEDGKLIEENLKRNRLTREELAAAARVEQIASLDDVRWAVLETSGQISFIPKSSS